MDPEDIQANIDSIVRPSDASEGKFSSSNIFDICKTPELQKDK